MILMHMLIFWQIIFPGLCFYWTLFFALMTSSVAAVSLMQNPCADYKATSHRPFLPPNILPHHTASSFTARIQSMQHIGTEILVNIKRLMVAYVRKKNIVHCYL